MNVAMVAALTMVASVSFDAALGEPRRAHPLVAFGRWARAVERALHADRRRTGVVAWLLAVLPLVTLAWSASLAAEGVSHWLAAAFNAALLYFAIGLRSLGEHARPVADALDRDEMGAAHSAVGRLVSRDVLRLDATQVSAAATESVLENGNDAVFGALFWFAVLGAPGAVLYRLANTLDAMWGYRTPRYGRFGWAAARADDVLNLVPARLTAFTYALLGNTARALRCWWRQARLWDSPNAGPVMAAGAGALNVRLGGAAPYDGVWEARPELGEGDTPNAASIHGALRLVRRSVLLWLGIALSVAWIAQEWLHA